MQSPWQKQRFITGQVTTNFSFLLSTTTEAPSLDPLQVLGHYRTWVYLGLPWNPLYSSCHHQFCDWLVPVLSFCLFDINVNHIFLTIFLMQIWQGPQHPVACSPRKGKQGGWGLLFSFPFPQFRKWELYSVLAHTDRLMVWHQIPESILGMSASGTENWISSNNEVPLHSPDISSCHHVWWLWKVSSFLLLLPKTSNEALTLCPQHSKGQELTKSHRKPAFPHYQNPSEIKP